MSKCLLIFLTFTCGMLYFTSVTLPNYSGNYMNHSNASFTNQLLPTYQMESTHFFPHLPIQIYTANRQKFLQLKNPRKQIILLANSFFGDPQWEIPSLKNRTNSGNMSEIFCAFLNNHCEITNDMDRFHEADAVVYHAVDMINRSDEKLRTRRQSQRFVFALWESPKHYHEYDAYDKFFNWSMTYRLDSHIVTPYYTQYGYRSKDYKIPIEEKFDSQPKHVLFKNINPTQKLGTAAALISNCDVTINKRLEIIKDLEKYIDVTIYGRCGQPCPNSTAHDRNACRAYLAERYYFLLAFENSVCEDYVTEKLFATLLLPIVPVVYGGANYTRYVPESAFIDTRKFPSAKELSQRLIQIRNNITLYQEYFRWKENIIWDGFTNFFTPFCDLCLRLHLDNTSNIIGNINRWWTKDQCT
ncbi:unnamed protein product [Adineta ricciae]|uniref:Fucosyltransferase n=1 Tax=Adineta ricciae TaxID=249248 RepID=A0A813Y1I4_ADIRI|nr:unnamed protein product [Adineta ricciae]